jgi:acetyl-CoA carboxylase biotin carboxyl carrier protein
MMTPDELKQILDLVREYELNELDLEREGVKLRVKKGGAAPVVAAPMAASPAMMLPAGGPAAAPGGVVPAPAEEEGEAFAVVKAPIVGTFYRAPAPEAPAFAEVGQIVRKGQILCIIEAMKLMNEIESEYDGEVVKVFVENGQPVQYGERLFAIKAR